MNEVGGLAGAAAVVALLLAGVFLSARAHGMTEDAATVYVAANGSDSWSGRLSSPAPDGSDGPLATFHAALDAARQAPAGSPRRIVVGQGRYLLERPLVLDSRDKGLTVEAAPGARPVLCAGRVVTGWTREGDFYAADLPDVKSGAWDFRMLVVNGRVALRARLPEDGFFEHESAFDVRWMSTTGGGWERKPTDEELTTLIYSPADIGPWLEPRNAEITVYHMWDESLVGVRENDVAQRALRFSTPAGHPPGAFGVKRYVVWNVREGMKRPGQWYLDRAAGRVVYWPLGGEDMDTAEIIAPTAESIIRIEGTRDAAAGGITISGLALTVTNTPLRSGGFGAGAFEGALSVEAARDCVLDDLEISNVGGQGVKARDADVVISDSRVHHTGACGIMIDGGAVTGNRIHNVGTSYPSAIGLWINGKTPVTASGNDIHDTPYTAIACSGEGHVIERNLIHHAMQQLADGAAVYVTFARNVTVRGNFVRDMPDRGLYGASAYYLDEQAEDCLVEKNVSLGSSRPSHNHMARRNTLRNNIFISDADMTLTFPRSDDFVFEQNVLVAPGAVTFEGPLAIETWRSNVISSGDGAMTLARMERGESGDEKQVAQHEGVLFADPMLETWREGRITFAPASPALRLGIEPVDVSAAGL